MRCPVDDETLQMSERQGVEIDYCPKCRGVWLDRGELDKILERAAVELGGAVSDRDDERYRDDVRRDRDDVRRDRDDVRYRDDDRRDRDDDRYRDDPYRRYEGKPHKRKRSFLSDMFEFGD